MLLAVNLVVKGARSAEAQVEADRGEPYVVEWLVRATDLYYRVWSDGQIDQWQRFDPPSCDFLLTNLVQGPTGHDFPVVSANYASRAFVLRYADGRVDHLVDTGLLCTIAGQGSDPFCIGDTDRSGVTDFQDIVNVLSDWGECGERR